MNPKISALLSPKILKPDFIKQKDIRKITPEFLMNRFQGRVSTSSYKEHGADYLVLKIARKNEQKPDIYMFKDGKFASRFTQRKRAGSDLYISTYALENGFVTKTVERDKSTNKSFSYNVETVIDTVKKANRGLLEKLFFASEKLNLRIKRHKVFDGVDETTALKKYVPLWTIKLSNKDQQLKATCTPDKLFVKKTTPDAWFKYSTQAKLSLGENIDNLIKNALKWFDGEFKS